MLTILVIFPRPMLSLCLGSVGRPKSSRLAVWESAHLDSWNPGYPFRNDGLTTALTFAYKIFILRFISIGDVVVDVISIRFICSTSASTHSS